jgi:hypothetical protein
MRQVLNLSIAVWFGAVSCFAAPLVPPTPAEKVIFLPGDELVLPPLLRRFDGGSILNVTSIKSKSRSAKEGEWLEFGDYFSLRARLSVQVILLESLQWVGGGVFQGRIGQRSWKETHTPYEFFLDHGWMKVWAKIDDDKNSLKLYTKNVYLKTDDAVFWVNTRPGRTEVYLVKGEITDSVGRTFKEKKFYLWEGEKHSLKFTSKEWNEQALEVQIAGLYPNLVKLADKADEEWTKGTSESVYADLRRQGWRKVDRHEPDPGTYTRQKKK